MNFEMSAGSTSLPFFLRWALTRRSISSLNWTLRHVVQSHFEALSPAPVLLVLGLHLIQYALPFRRAGQSLGAAAGWQDDLDAAADRRARAGW